MVNLTNLMMVWKTRNGEPTKGGYQQMLNRLDKLKQVENWTDDAARDLRSFCEDFRVTHELLKEDLDPFKCLVLFNDINKF